MSEMSNGAVPVARCVAALAALAVSLAVYAGEESSSAEEPFTATDYDCVSVSTPMIDIPTAGDTEPRVRIPRPSGWERDTVLGDDDESVRFALAPTELSASERRTNAIIVTVAPAEAAPAEAIFAEMTDRDPQMATGDLTVTARSVCGLPAQTLTRNEAATDADAAIARPGTVLQVVAEADGETHVVTVTATAGPDNPGYRRDIDTVLAGLQVLPAAG